MSWLELKLQITRSDAAELENLLDELGAVSITMMDAEDKPLFEPGPGETPLWDNLVVTGLFTEDTDADALQEALRSAWLPRQIPAVQASMLVDQNWVRAWLDDFKPMRFGNKLWVCPSWWMAGKDGGGTADWTPTPEDAESWEIRNHDLLGQMQQAGNSIMLLDPGLAFGTGTHPTTSLCLQWLDAAPLRNQTLVDYGCGSGILGIAGLLLGAKLVYGIDNDPQALTATSDNCAKNQLDPARFPVFMPADFQQAIQRGSIQPVDGMMANILAGTLIELAEALATQVKKGGWILLSGILCEQADAVVTAYTPWFTDCVITAEKDWVRISAIRK
ncbi:MAG: 50S ribosomal protein L11 methyltransferase [Pseudomonadota bacterium]